MESLFEACLMLTIVSVVGSIGNLIVVIVNITKSNKTTTSILILALAASDLITAILLIPLNIYMEWNDFAIQSRILCKLYHFLNTTIVPASCLLMTTIAFDRLFKICYPHSQFITNYRARIIVVLLFTISCLLGIIPALAVDIGHNIQTNQTTCNFEFLIVSRDAVFAFRYLYNSIYIISAVIITILYCIIYAEIRRRHKEKLLQKTILTNALAKYSVAKENIASKKSPLIHPTQDDNLLNEQSKINISWTKVSHSLAKDVRIAFMLFIVSALFIITYFPAILMTYEIIEMNLLIFFSYFIGTALNPIIYCFLNPSFREDSYHLIKKLLKN